MTFPTITERLGDLSAVGMTKEAVFGTPLAATNFVPDASCNIETDPGLFYPKVMQGQRDEQIWGLYGEYKHAGAISGPVFPVNGIPLFFGAIGVDGGAANAPLGNGITGTGSTSPTTLNGATIVGATQVTVTSAAGYATGNIIQIDVNLAGATSSECRKITTISTNTLTLDSPLNFAHANGVAVKIVTAPFTHNALPSNALSSFTIEKNVGGFESLQYAGCRVNKYDFKTEAGNKEASFTADVLAAAEAIMTTPTAISVDSTQPFVFAEYTLSLFGTNVLQASKFGVALDNGIKATYTYAQQHGPSFLTPITRKVEATASVVWSSFDDATYGYFTKMINGTQGAVTFSMAHPANGGSVAITLPQVRIKKQTEDIKIGDTIISNLSFAAELQLSSSQSITGQVLNSAYLPY